VERDALLDGSRIRAGHRLLGMASSGLHSNGYSLVRRVLERSGARLEDRFDSPSGPNRTLGEVLLEPTRIYVKPLLPILRESLVDGLAHVTGGGLTENIVRMIDASLGVHIDLAAWRRPPVFDWLQQNGGIDDSEMRRTFNCGIGMVAAVNPERAEAVLERIVESGIECHDIGEVIEAGQGPRVVFK
jgi:phosphoribosylformylglycinamidine cyclo-ligase